VLEDITAAVEAAIQRLDARDQAVEAHEKEKAARKERQSNRVSIAAIALTMLMSFLNFARSERDDAGRQARVDADTAKRDAEANWILYQTRTTERSGYVMTEDALTREVADLKPGDPRLRLAELNHVEYATRITALDNETRRVFFVIQDLERRSILKLREAQHIDRKIEQYDMGTRVLTLALVILSVTLLANQEHLFWIAIAIAFSGAGIAVNGYFAY
jgi:hypothetical protein